MTTNYEEIYARLDAEIPSVDKLLAIPILENGEELVCVDERDGILTTFHNSTETVQLVGERMIMRKKVAKFLFKARDVLEATNPNLRFKIFYAYRALEVQQKYYNSALETAIRQFPDRPEAEQLLFAHTLAAKPEVAGHPAAAAIDVTLYDLSTKKDLDMGVPINREEYRKAGKKIYTESPEIVGEARENRLFLRNLMQSVGFAPFSGEFWHFSFGDREWAAKLGKPTAMYGQLSVEEVLRSFDPQLRYGTLVV